MQSDSRQEKYRDGERQAALLNPQDIADQEFVIEWDLNYRTSVYRDKSEEGVRAHVEGSVTSRRVLKNETNQGGIQLILMPYSSSGDATVAMPRFPGFLVRQPFMKAEVVHEGFVSPSNLDSANAVCCETEYARRDGGPCFVRIVGSTYGRYVVLMFFVAKDAFWPWDSIANVVNAQLAKLDVVGIS
jgi:hypothetical protein